jgi:RNA polymerase II subunit A C-terminal domain phosphatase
LPADNSPKTMNKRPTTLHLPGHLPFPITITSLLVKPDSQIKKHDGLLVYKFLATVSDDRDGEEDTPVRKEMVEQFDSPWEGILTEWHITEGAVVSSSRFGFVPLQLLLTGASEPIVSVIEPCLHEISFKDICAICGADLSVYLPPICA